MYQFIIYKGKSTCISSVSKIPGSIFFGICSNFLLRFFLIFSDYLVSENLVSLNKSCLLMTVVFIVYPLTNQLCKKLMQECHEFQANQKASGQPGYTARLVSKQTSKQHIQDRNSIFSVRHNWYCFRATSISLNTLVLINIF